MFHVVLLVFRSRNDGIDSSGVEGGGFRALTIHRSTADSADVFAKRHNAVLRGWIEYFGKFWYRNFSYRLWSTFQSRLIKWVTAKYRVSTRKAEWKLAQLRKEKPRLFAHWYLLRATNA